MTEIKPPITILDQSLDRVRNGGRIMFRRIRMKANTRSWINGRARSTDIADDHRQAVTHGLENDISAWLPVTGKKKNIRRDIKLSDFFAWKPAVEPHPISKAQLGSKRFACSPVKTFTDNIQNNRQITHQTHSPYGVSRSFGTHQPPDKEKLYLTGARRPVHHGRKLGDSSFAHQLETLEVNTSQKFLDVRRDTDDATCLLVGFA